MAVSSSWQQQRRGFPEANRLVGDNLDIPRVYHGDFYGAGQYLFLRTAANWLVVLVVLVKRRRCHCVWYHRHHHQGQLPLRRETSFCSDVIRVALQYQACLEMVSGRSRKLEGFRMSHFVLPRFRPRFDFRGYRQSA